MRHNFPRGCFTLTSRIFVTESPGIEQPTLYEPEQLIDAPPKNLLLVQVTDPQVYADAHIEGAVNVTPRELVSGVPPATGRLPEVAALEALFGSIGYQQQQTIVAYDDEGGGWAGRLGWTLDVIGHPRWGYLNGGLHAWRASGLPLSNAPTQVSPTQPALRIDTAPIAEIPDVLAAIGDPGHVIWDVRSQEEYLGLRRSASRAGHIPSAVNTDWLNLKDPENHTRLIKNLEPYLAEHGVSRDKTIITHCQTHHRSALSYMIGRLLGFPHIKGYHGSWSEWGNRDDTPITIDPNE